MLKGKEDNLYNATKYYRCLEYHQKQTEDIYLTYCGIEACTPGKGFYANKRSGYHLHVILSGRGTLCVEGKTQNLHFGQMFITKPNEETWYRASKEEPWKYCWMTFDGNNAGFYAEKAGFEKKVNWQNCYVEVQQFYSLVQRIMEKPELNLPNELMRLGMLLEYLSLAIDSHYQSVQATRHTHEYAPDVYVNHALDYIHHYYSSIKVNDVARYIGINRSYLSDIFKKKMGVSPREYLRQYRLNQGCRMLLETQLSIQEIAKQIGYDNPLTFSKTFKAAYGVSPRNYRFQGGVIPDGKDMDDVDD